jgi:hypothetical protein
VNRNVVSPTFSLSKTQRMAPPAAMAGLALYGTTQDTHAKEAKKVDLDKVRESIVQTIEDDAEKRDNGTSLAGTFIRLAWHW